MKEAKLEVKSHVKKCRAKVERKVIQARDVMLTSVQQYPSKESTMQEAYTEWKTHHRRKKSP